LVGLKIHKPKKDGLLGQANLGGLRRSGTKGYEKKSDMGEIFCSETLRRPNKTLVAKGKNWGWRKGE